MCDYRDIDFVIVNYNTKDLLQDLYRQIRKMFTKPSVIIVDNASDDGSVSYLKRLKAPCVILNATNKGYAAACNQGASAGSAPYLCFLNTDVLLKPGAIESALAAFECERVVLAGPQQVKLNDEPLMYNFVGGACMLARREWYEDVGGMDERYFFGGDDVDLTRRATEQGYLWRITEPAIVHVHGGSHTEETRAHILEGLAMLDDIWSEIALEYDGPGFIIGVPSRDLSRADLINLKVRGFDRDEIVASGLYKNVRS